MTVAIQIFSRPDPEILPRMYMRLELKLLLLEDRITAIK